MNEHPNINPSDQRLARWICEQFSDGFGRPHGASKHMNNPLVVSREVSAMYTEEEMKRLKVIYRK